MAIRFPKMHIAASAANRLLNVADQIENHGSAETMRIAKPIPPVPYTAEQQGENLDAALAQPVPPLPGLASAPDPGGTVAGRPLLSTVLKPEAQR